MRSTVAAAVTAVALLSVATPAAAAVILNGGFELGAFSAQPFDTLAAGSTAITGWDIGGAGVDWIGTYWQPSQGARSLDLSALDPGSVSQDIVTEIGRRYIVSFDLAGNVAGTPTIKDVDVTIDGLAELTSTYGFDTTGNTLSSMGWLTYTYEFVATGTVSRLSFSSATAGSAGPALDNVSIAEVAGVPDAATWISMIAGFGLVGGMVRRRRAALA